MAHNGQVVRRRVVGPDYMERLNRIAEFVEAELGPGNNPRPRPNDRAWRIQRRTTIRKLGELRGKLDNICVAANYVKAGGNTAELCGAVANIVGALMAFGNLPSGQTVLHVGNLVNNTGTFANKLSTLAESLLSAEFLREVETVLKKDQELSRPLQEWLQFSRDLDENIVGIFGCSLSSEKWGNVSRFFLEFSTLHIPLQSVDRTLELMESERYSLHIGTDVQIQKVMEFSQQLESSPELSEKLRKMCSVLSTTTSGMLTVITGNKLYNQLCGETSEEAVCSETHSFPSLRGGSRPERPTARQVSVHCAFQAIDALTSLLSLINVISIIREGKCRYSDALRELSDLLSSELRAMEAMNF
ncbi:uncharacterized protein CEXT_138941 [Caerostris extrusa]|uniref:Uncharacterized protein n=1 Tax=Caerostris extrusa TaxID=172846 RepID=A0AAV4MMG2_CAEEX|nr:uncharacterized protein CEXT_138941 [Caerostris extrusa]